MHCCAKSAGVICRPSIWLATEPKLLTGLLGLENREVETRATEDEKSWKVEETQAKDLLARAGDKVGSWGRNQGVLFHCKEQG
jgi:hypothetical protein